MKYAKIFLLGVIFSFLFGTNVSWAQSDLDTVYNDGTVEPFQVLGRSVSGETLPYNGDNVVAESGVVPTIPEGTAYIDAEKDPRVIIGPDNRKIVSNTTADPYRKVCFLVMTFPDGKSFIGTGNLVSADLVLTAGHCIYSKNNGGWAKSVAVYPGNNGSYAPYGVAYAKNLMSISGWTSSASSQHDIGAIRLDRSVGNTVGWFGLTTALTSPITLSGYHGDLNRRMGTETGTISTSTANNVFYKLDSTGGASGSGVYNNAQQILAVHAYGQSTNNFGTRLNYEKFSLVKSWIDKKAQGVNYTAHVMSNGWLSEVANGATGGTTGQSRRMEAIRINLAGLGYSGGIQYRAHVQSNGWLPWVSNNGIAGTTGQSRRMEAVQIQLTGTIASYYHVEYRAHVQSKGWLPWVRNGATAGTTGEARQMEAVQIRLVKK